MKATANQRDAQTDEQLIRNFLAGDQRAFAELVQHYQHPIFNLCFRMLNHREDAADCTQDTFISAYKALPKFRFQATFQTWITRIALNTCKNKLASAEYRHRAKRVGLSEDGKTSGEEGSYPVLLKDESSSPERLFEQQQTRRAILTAITALPYKYRILIVLCDLEERSYQEIAAITGLKTGTVKSKLARARQKLRIQLEGVLKYEM